MKRHILSLLLVALPLSVFSTTITYGQKSGKARPKPCASQIVSVLNDTIFKRAFVGIKIVSLKSGKIIYQENADKLFRPASNIKLFTTATALALLGKDFEFKTEVYADSNFRDGTLHGRLYLKGYGDPLLTTEDLDTLARRVSEFGIRWIQGDLVGDVSYFDDLYWGKGWMWDDDPEAHAPYISALSVNHNAVEVEVIGGYREGDSAQVLLDPSSNYFSVINHARTGFETVDSPLTVTRKWKERENILLINGYVRPFDAKTYSVNVWKPEFYALGLFKEKLKSYNVNIAGILRLDTVRHAFPITAVSHRLDSVAFYVNKESYNLGAENMLKALAAEKLGAGGNADTGISIMRDYLYTINIDTTAFVFADGSGKSRYNLASPNALVQLLAYQYGNTSLSEDFMRTLPIAGIDGTLKDRIGKTGARWNVQAKTGSHSDVIALSGYVANTKGEILAFSIVINHFAGDSAPYRKAQDRIVELLIDCK